MRAEGVLRLRPLFQAVTDVAVRAFEEHREEHLVTKSPSDEGLGDGVIKGIEACRPVLFDEVTE